MTAAPEVKSEGPPPTDWQLTENFLDAHPTRWGSLSWIAARPLISSLNDVFGRRAAGLVTELRRHHTRGLSDADLMVDAAAVESFVVIGDTGEQDPSQYVVGPAWSRAVRDTDAGFVLIMSDVIYPSGDVNDYVDGIYQPYRSPVDAQFRVDAPLFALPGNHDWYDGLFGFMYHFCGRDQRPPGHLYAPTEHSALSLRAGFADRVARILWRRPPKPSPATEALRAAAPGLGHGRSQPGPFYVVDTAYVRVVAIDTGIERNIDPDQLDWLERVSRGDRPKVLVTGAPLLVDGHLDECASTTPGDQRTVWGIVNDPRHHYVATVGGDIHNFQRYAGSGVPDTPAVHLVCGAGGAFMHATHPITLARSDDRRRSRFRDPDLTFPTGGESFGFFARQLIPSIWRILRLVLLFILGTALGTAALWLGHEYRPGTPYERWLGWATVAALGVVLVIRLALPRRIYRSSPSKRALVAAAGLLVGLLVAVVGYQLDPILYLFFFRLWLFAAVCHVGIAWGISRTGWWLPAHEHPASLAVRTPVFYAGLGAICLALFALQVFSFVAPGQRVLAVISALALFGIGAYGWRQRRRRRTDWRTRSTLFAVGAQIGYVGVVVLQLSLVAGFVGEFVGGVLGLLLAPVLALVAAAVLVGLTELGTVGARRRGQDRRPGWSRAARVTHHLPLIVLGGLIGVWIALADTPPVQAAIGVTLVLTLVVAGVLFVDSLRRYLHRTYLAVAVTVLVVVAALAYRWSGWPVAVVLATTMIIFAFAAAVLLGHLVFLGGLRILFDRRAHRGEISFTPDELTEIFAAKLTSRVPNVHPRVRTWAQLTYPGVGEPGGLLQSRVAEIYSRDEPPFFKGFLSFRATASRLHITLHQVFGDRPSQTVPVADIPLT